MADTIRTAGTSTATTLGTGAGTGGGASIPLMAPQWTRRTRELQLGPIYAFRNSVYTASSQLQVWRGTEDTEVRSARGQVIRLTERRREALGRVYQYYPLAVSRMPVNATGVSVMNETIAGFRTLSDTLNTASKQYSDGAVLFEQDLSTLYDATYTELETRAKGGDLEAQQALDLLIQAEKDDQGRLEDSRRSKDKAYASGAGDREELQTQNELLLEQVNILKQELAQVRRAQVTGDGAASAGPVPRGGATTPAARRATRR